MVTRVTPAGTMTSCSTPVGPRVTEPVHLPDGLHAHVAPGGQPTVQSAQTSPSAPHAVVTEPGWHVAAPQQPPLQVRPPAQLAPHLPVVGSQASPVGQLVVVQRTGASGPETWVSGRTSRDPSRNASRDASRIGWTVTSVPPSVHEPTHSRPASSREHAATEPATIPAASAASRTESRLRWMPSMTPGYRVA